MTKWIVMAVSLAVSSTALADEDVQHIRAAALDYIEGWYDGDGDRMARSLHPRLVKRIVEESDGTAVLDEMTAAQLISLARAGGGRNSPPASRRTDVTVLDVFGNAASVRVDAGDWIDYMQLARWNGEWKIINVLWEMRP